MIPAAKRIFPCITLFALLCAPTGAQPPQPAFDVTEVQPTPHTATPYMTGGMLHGDRYTLHNASMLDMIALAYGVDTENVIGGPAWIDLDRFDITARAPRGTSAEDVKLMLRALLADRFKLVLHNGTAPRPTYVLRVDKGGPKLRQADDAETPNIEQHHTSSSPAPGTPSYFSVTCRNQTMAGFVGMLSDFATAYLASPIADATGLKGGFDFDLAWTWKPEPGGRTIFEAVQKQLGLRLALEQYPMPVTLVDSVNLKPTPNAPGIEKELPPPPPSEFEVTVLTPGKPGAEFTGNISGNQITATSATLKFFVTFAYQINPNDNDLIVNAPKYFEQDKWDILAKAAPDAQATSPSGKAEFDFDLLPHMVQTMLAERFHMKSHFENRPVDAFTLIAANPRMIKADPTNRTGCKEGPGRDGKDPRIANPILGRLIACQNMTMAQFADQIPTLANGYIFTPVLDATGLAGAYDFTLSFSSAGQLHSPGPPAPGSDANSPATQSDPSGALSLQDAMARQLGIRLEKRRRPVQVLVIDHLDEKPTDN